LHSKLLPIKEERFVFVEFPSHSVFTVVIDALNWLSVLKLLLDVIVHSVALETLEDSIK